MIFKLDNIDHCIQNYFTIIIKHWAGEKNKPQYKLSIVYSLSFFLFSIEYDMTTAVSCTDVHYYIKALNN